MSTKYLTGAVIVILGSFLVVVSQAFSSHLLGWVGFGVAIGIVTIVALAQFDRGRGAVQRSLDGMTVAVSGLVIAFSVAASGSSVIWLTFAFALGIVAAAFAGLTLHEVSSWRAQQGLSNLHWLPGADIETAAPQSHAA
jgi:hypothetical protein